MENIDLEKLKYPIGKFAKPESYTADLLKNWKNTIAEFPNMVKKTTENLGESQLNTPYRPQGWTIRQVVHHCADSHMNAFIRFKLALTEEVPTIKPYEEQLWAEQADYKLPLEASLKILEGLHYRWNVLLESMNETDFENQYIHPATGKKLDLYFMLGLYDWHCRHHLAHIMQAIQEN
jgi:DinB superfamily